MLDAGKGKCSYHCKEGAWSDGFLSPYTASLCFIVTITV